MSARLGRQYWWPAQTSFEVMIGAILTQNTAWTNVEKAIQNLNSRGLINPEEIYKFSRKGLGKLIRPSGYYNVKAERLKNFTAFLRAEFGFNIKKMKKGAIANLRPKLLHVNGIGPETADSILLYALDKPIFVVDAYTRRIMSEHGFAAWCGTYDNLQKLFMDYLPRDVKLFNEYHALLVNVGKNYCRPRKPLCDDCPLKLL